MKQFVDNIVYSTRSTAPGSSGRFSNWHSTKFAALTSKPMSLCHIVVL